MEYMLFLWSTWTGYWVYLYTYTYTMLDILYVRIFCRSKREIECIHRGVGKHRMYGMNALSQPSA